MNPESRTMLPKLAFTGFAARYREPKVEEGFDDVTKVDFKVRVPLACAALCLKMGMWKGHVGWPPFAGGHEVPRASQDGSDVPPCTSCCWSRQRPWLRTCYFRL